MRMLAKASMSKWHGKPPRRSKLTFVTQNVEGQELKEEGEHIKGFHAKRNRVA